MAGETKTDIIDSNNNGTKIDELFSKIVEDKIVDGNDIKEISKLYSEFKSETGRVRLSARGRMHEVLFSRLRRGFLMSNENDFDVFIEITKMLSFGKLGTPFYSDVKESGFPVVAYLSKRKDKLLFVKGRNKKIGEIDMTSYKYDKSDSVLRRRKSTVKKNTILKRDIRRVEQVFSNPIFSDLRSYMVALQRDRRIDGSDLGNIKLILEALRKPGVTKRDKEFIQDVLRRAFINTLKIGYGLKKGVDYQVDLQVLVVMLAITYKTNLFNAEISGDKDSIEEMLEILNQNTTGISSGIGLLLDFLNVEIPGLGLGIRTIIKGITEGGLLVRLDGDKLIFSQKLTWKIGEINIKTKKWEKKGGYFQFDLESIWTRRRKGWKTKPGMDSINLDGFRGLTGDNNDFNFSIDG